MRVSNANFRLLTLLIVGTVLSMNAQSSTPKKATGTADSISPQSVDAPEALSAVLLTYNSVIDGFQSRQRTGSAQKLSRQDIERYGSLDPNRLFQTLTGVQVYEEDGFGLRPNISMRGTAPLRSAKINLMEDGIPAAPAPYSAPAAYYFPSLGRMSGLEVFKGSSQIEYGPNTSGGAINFMSVALPKKFTLEARGSGGQFDTQNQRFTLGDQIGKITYITQWLGYQSDGFKTIDGGGSTGFNKQDFLTKLKWAPKGHNGAHQFIVKFGYAQERANETYLGLTESDYNQDPYRRYAASQNDEMRSYHQQVSLTHLWSLNRNITITSSLYNNQFRRNWYKLDGVRVGDEKIKIASILAEPELYNSGYQSLIGPNQIENTALEVKANNRTYYSRGAQTRVDWTDKNNPKRQLSLGLRWHEDAEDRFQWVDTYELEDQKMILTNPGIRGSNANKIKKAQAVSAFLQYTERFGALTFKPGLRIESINLSAIDYGADNLDRQFPAQETTLNESFVIIPGLGACWKPNNEIQLFGGLHKGFSPSGFTPESQPEVSWNSELGGRYKKGNLNGELLGFFNHYQRLLGNDLAAGGGYGNNERFNAGEARVWGVEATIKEHLILNQSKKLWLPIQLSYTWTNTSFLSSFDSDNSLFGQVQLNDEMPYIAPHQGSVQWGLEHPKWQFNFNARLQSNQRSSAGQGGILPNELIPSRTIIDLSFNYQISPKLHSQISLINASNQRYLAARNPAGLRPGLPRSLTAALSYKY